MDKSLDIDLYQARMLIAFYKSGMQDLQGTMEGFTRSLPPHRNFLVVCGIDRISEYLKNLKFNEYSIRILKTVLPEIDWTEDLCNYMAGIDFSKLNVRAMADGDIVFAKEPVISVSGPIGIAQYIETKILSILNHDIRIASKAARIYLAAQGRPVAEFGSRREPDTIAPEAARAAYIGGFSSTSSVSAYAKYGIPVSGTMGHVWIMSHISKHGVDGEALAYKHWADLFPNSTYLPDTYNTIDGVKKVLDNCPKDRIGGIRLDSGNLGDLSAIVKRLLTNADLYSTKIGATNDLDEYSINELVQGAFPIDWFGVGTKLVSTPDAPTCNFIYKLVQVEDAELGTQYVSKIAAGGKETLLGAKQVFRHYDAYTNKYTNDTIGLQSDEYAARKMLQPLTIGSVSNIEASRAKFISELNKLPKYLYTLGESSEYPISKSKELLSKMQDFMIIHK